MNAVRLRWRCHIITASSAPANAATVRLYMSANVAYATGIVAMPNSAIEKRTVNVVSGMILNSAAVK